MWSAVLLAQVHLEDNANDLREQNKYPHLPSLFWAPQASGSRAYPLAPLMAASWARVHLEGNANDHHEQNRTLHLL